MNFRCRKLSHEVVGPIHSLISLERHEALLRLAIDERNPLHLRSRPHLSGHPPQVCHFGARNRSDNQLLAPGEKPRRGVLLHDCFDISPLVGYELIGRRRSSAFRACPDCTPAVQKSFLGHLVGDLLHVRLVRADRDTQLSRAEGSAGNKQCSSNCEPRSAAPAAAVFNSGNH